MLGLGQAEIDMVGKNELPSAEQIEPLPGLQREKAERLAELLKRKRTDKHYKKTLRAYLDADDALQQELLKRLGLG
jgi:hypothetical protein